MKYYELLDDINIPGRWHLGEIINSIDGSTLELWTGSPLDKAVSLEAEITHPGKALDFSLTSFATPIARERLARAMAGISRDDLQLLPIRIAGHSDFQVLNVVRVIRCLDEQRSEFMKWTEQDHRADKAGQYRMVTNLKLDATQIPSDVHIFRLEGWKIAIVVSEEVKATMEGCGCVGAKFQLAT